MGHLIGIGLMVIIGCWAIRAFWRIPSEIRNILAMGGGFLCIAALMGCLTLIVSGVGLGPGDKSGWSFVTLCLFCAFLMVMNAWLALNVAHRFMTVQLHRKMRKEQRTQAAALPSSLPRRVSWSDYRG